MNKLVLLLTALLCATTFAGLRAEETSPFVPTPLPTADLSAFEPSVAGQLSEARALVDRHTQSPGVSAEHLSEAYGQLGRLYHAYQLQELAEVCYSNAGKLDRRNLDWPYLYGVLKQEQGDYREAIEAYRYVLGKDGSYDAARIRQARAYRALGEMQQAADALQPLLPKRSADAVMQAELGELALAQGDYVNAVSYLQQALEQVPQANRLHYPLALAYRHLGNGDLARQHMALRGENGIAIGDPLVDELQDLKQGERLHLLHGKLAFNAGDYPAAEQAFRRALEAKPDSVRAQVNLAATLGTLGQTEQAIEHFRRALALDPDNGTAQFNLAVLLFEQGDLTGAREILEQRIQADPEDSAARLYLANILLRQNAIAEAFEQFKAVTETDPGSSQAWMAMAKLLVGNGQYREALQVLESAQRALPYDLEITHALARLYGGSPDLSLRDAQKAGQLAFQAYRAQPTPGRAVTAAMALGEAEKCEQAANLLENSARTQPRAEYRQQLQAIIGYYRDHRPCREAPVLGNP